MSDDSASTQVFYVFSEKMAEDFLDSETKWLLEEGWTRLPGDPFDLVWVAPEGGEPVRMDTAGNTVRERYMLEWIARGCPDDDDTA